MSHYFTKETTENLYYALKYIHTFTTSNFPSRLNRIILLQKKAVKIIAKAALRENTGRLSNDMRLPNVDWRNK